MLGGTEKSRKIEGGGRDIKRNGEDTLKSSLSNLLNLKLSGLKRVEVKKWITDIC